MFRRVLAVLVLILVALVALRLVVGVVVGAVMAGSGSPSGGARRRGAAGALDAQGRQAQARSEGPRLTRDHPTARRGSGGGRDAPDHRAAARAGPPPLEPTQPRINETPCLNSATPRSSTAQSTSNVYLETDGEVGHDWRNGAPTLILTTTGRKSGEERQNALIYGMAGDNPMIVASKGGNPSAPRLVPQPARQAPGPGADPRRPVRRHSRATRRRRSGPSCGSG